MLLRSEQPHEVSWRDDLRAVTSAAGLCKMMIFSHEVIGRGDDSAVGELVVVRIICDELKAVGWMDEEDVVGDLKQSLQHRPAGWTSAFGDDFLIFEHHRRADGEGESLIKPCLENGMKGMACGAGLEEDIGVQHRDHAA